MTTIEIMLVIAIILQTVATVISILLINQTKFNVLWICCIVGFTLLTAERVCQLLAYDNVDVPPQTFIWLGIIISFCFSVGLLFANVLIRYIDRINHNRRLLENRLMTAVLRTEERSRADFSRELHDGLGPLLSSAKMSLSAVSCEGMDDERRAIVENTAYVIDEAIRSLREISNNMSPHVLADFGLVRGVQNFIQKCTGMHDVKIRFMTDLRSERFDANVEVILYRVICELINNSLKHAACTEISLSLSQGNGRLSLDYSDNGRGFDPQAMMDCGMGLSNIASRVHSLNGTFDIRGRKGKGMSAAVRIGVGEETRRPNRRGKNRL